MTKNADPVRRAQGMLAMAVRYGHDQVQPRRELTGAKLRSAVERALSDEYPPTPDQRAELAELLAGGER